MTNSNPNFNERCWKAFEKRHVVFIEKEMMGSLEVEVYKQTTSYAGFKLWFAFQEFRNALAEVVRSKMND